MRKLIYTTMLLLLISISHAATYSVCKSGCDFSDIGVALNNITMTDNTIEINGSGSYASGQLNISSNTTAAVITISADDVEIDLTGTTISGNTSGTGIYATGTNITVKNIKIERYSTGIEFNTVSESAVEGLDIDSTNYGITFTTVNTSVIKASDISNAAISSILLNSAEQNLISGMTITSSGIDDIRSSGTGTDNILFNSSVDAAKLSFTENSILEIIWPVTVNVKDSSNADVSGITLNITDRSETLVASDITDGDGNIHLNITQAVINSTGTDDRNNHTIYGYNSTHFLNCTINISSNSMINLTLDTTPPLLGNISNITTNSSAQITITADEKASLFLEYGTTSGLGTNMTASQYQSSHSENITGLLNNTLYYINATLCNEVGLCMEYGPYTFMTDQTTDKVPPSVSSVAVSDINSSAATVTWETDEEATTTIKYGTASGTYQTTITNTTLAYNHTIYLSSLSESTTYYYVINATDSEGNTIQSSEYSFQTIAGPDTTPPAITFNSPANQSTLYDWNGISISITTDEAATCYIDSYKIGSSAITTDLALATSNNLTHTRTINATADSAGYTHYFTYVCTDAHGNSGSATVYFKMNDTTPTTISTLSATIDDGDYTNDPTQEILIVVSETQYTGYPQLSLDSGSTVTMTNHGTYYSYTTGTLSDAIHNITIFARDLKGNLNNISFSFTVDTEDPDMDVHSPEKDMVMKDSTGLVLNISTDEDATCEYEILLDDQDWFDRCEQDCEDDYDACYDDAADSAEKTECSEDKTECEDKCSEDRYSKLEDGKLENEIDLETCTDTCDKDYDSCEDTCNDEEDTCLDDAETSSQEDDCRDEKDDCKDDCKDDKDTCYEKCDEKYFTFSLEYESYLKNGDYMITYTCKDKAGNKIEDNVSFEVKDTTAPKIISTSPRGTLPKGDAELEVETHEKAVCRFSETDQAYDKMEEEFTQTGTFHSYKLADPESKDHVYYIRCNDSNGNVMTSSQKISFTIEGESSETENAQDTSDENTIKEAKFTEIKTKQPEIMKITDDFPVSEVSLTSNEDVEDVELKLEKIGQVAGSEEPEGKVYQYFRITKSGITNKQIEKVTIKFKVDKTWLKNNGLSAKDIVLKHMTDKWTEVTPQMTTEDQKYQYYQADVSDLSTFAIVGKQSEEVTPVQESPSPVNDAPEIPDDEPEEIEEDTNYMFLWILLLCVVVVGGGSTAFVVLRSRHPQHDLKAVEQKQLAQDPAAAEAAASSPSDLDTYIKEELESNIPKQEIIASLTEAGYDEEEMRIKLDSIEKEQEISKYYEESSRAGKTASDITDELISAGYDEELVKKIIRQPADMLMTKGISESNREDQEIDMFISRSISSGISTEDIREALIEAGYDKEKIEERLLQVGDELGNYVTQALAAGMEPETIRESLVRAGYDEELVEEKFSQMNISLPSEDDIREYIFSATDQGLSEDEILRNLVAAGFPEKKISDLMVSMGIMEPPEDPLDVYIKRASDAGMSYHDMYDALKDAGYPESMIISRLDYMGIGKDMDLSQFSEDTGQKIQQGIEQHTQQETQENAEQNIAPRQDPDKNRQPVHEQPVQETTGKKTKKHDTTRKLFKRRRTDKDEADKKTAEDAAQKQDIDPKLEEYVYHSLKAGYTKEQIRDKLKRSGYGTQEIETVLKRPARHHRHIKHDPHPISQELIDYVEKCRSEKLSRWHTKRLLKKAGYTKDEIKSVISTVYKRQKK